MGLILSFSACKNQEDEVVKYGTWKDLDGKTFSILTGSIYDAEIEKNFPDSGILYCSTTGDTIATLLEGKVEATLIDNTVVEKICKENEELTYFDDAIVTFDISGFFPKTDEGQVNANSFNLFLQGIEDSGVLSDLQHKWFNNECDELIDYESLPNINGVLKDAVDTSFYPFVFVSNNHITGFEVELLYLYCKEMGYALEINAYDFAGVLAAVSGGKADCAFCSLISTEERAENFIFSDSFYKGSGKIIIRKENASSKFNNFHDLDGMTVGALSGTVADQFAAYCINDAKYEYFDATSDALQALLNGKIDAFTNSSSSLSKNFRESDQLKLLGCTNYSEIAYIFPKGQEDSLLCIQLNEFIDKCRSDGRLDAWYDEWFNEEGIQDVDYEGMQDINGTIQMAVCSSVGGASCFIKNNKLVGMDIEVIVEFAREYGYYIEMSDYNFGGMVAAVSAGKVDIGGSNITVTAERKQSLAFSKGVYPDNIEVYVLNEASAVEKTNIIEDIKNSFYKTFIVENRYQLYINGVVSTLIITLCSIILGSAAGVILYILLRRNNKIMNKVLALYTWLVNGMPTVVLLMVFFYIIFGKTSLDGLFVSIIAFSVLFSVTIMGLLKTCFMAVDNGQFEAAYALGYSNTDTIIKIIIPEIMPMFFPGFRVEIINLIKATSIVGYIAVQDLTKVSDIIRSRTYEAFFPLIVTSVLYFILGGIFNLIIKYIAGKFDNKNRKKEQILRGIKEHD